jgi:hypothetical protein
MFANLIAYNNAGRGIISQGSVEYNANDPEDVIQLGIGTHRYLFNSLGELQTSGEIVSSMNTNLNDSKGTCASFPEKGTCIPTNFKTEDK